MKKWIIVSDWNQLEQYYVEGDIWTYSHDKSSAKQFSSKSKAQAQLDELVKDQSYMENELSIQSTLSTSTAVNVGGKVVRTITVSV